MISLKELTRTLIQQHVSECSHKLTQERLSLLDLGYLRAMLEASSSTWIMLESNPDVMNQWARAAGLDTSKAQFHDVFGFDEDLLSMIPQPVKAVILLFPNNDWLQVRRDEEDERVESGHKLIERSVIWMPQTIRHACGAMAMLHAFANSDVDIVQGSTLATFLAEIKASKSPQERAKILEATSEFAEIHANAAVAGQSAVPGEDDEGQHYTCFASVPDPLSEGQFRVVELNGGRKGPVDRGECTDLLRDVVKHIKEHYLPNQLDPRFNVLALAPPA